MSATPNSLPANCPPAIGLFDSGLGGLTVLQELRRALPHERFVYLGDTARTPYGAKSASTIERYSVECARFLLRHNLKFLVVACNTASAVALRQLEEICPCPVIGTIGPAVAAALAVSKTRKIGVIGTRATIASGVYERALQQIGSNNGASSPIEVSSVPCPLFVPLVEEGITSGEIVDQVIALYLSELRSAGVDTVILGCTHYPLLAPALQRFFGDQVSLVACSEAIAAEVALSIGRAAGAAEQVGGCQYFATDEVSRFNVLAQQFLGGEQLTAAHIEEL